VEERSRGSVGWLEAEWTEDQAHEAERPARTRRAFMIETIRRTRRAGVRGAIVATKPGNAGGAKGSREMDAT
jgi:hypothetical protein